MADKERKKVDFSLGEESKSRVRMLPTDENPWPKEPIKRIVTSERDR